MSSLAKGAGFNITCMSKGCNNKIKVYIEDLNKGVPIIINCEKCNTKRKLDPAKFLENILKYIKNGLS